MNAKSSSKRSMSEVISEFGQNPEKRPGSKLEEELHEAKINRDEKGNALGAALFVDREQLMQADINLEESNTVCYESTKEGLRLSSDKN